MTLIDRSVLQIGEAQFDVRPESEWIELKLGKTTTKFKKNDLWAMTFAIMGPEEQAKMMPVRRTETVHFEKLHKVKLLKDMRKGDTMVVKCRSIVEKTVVDGLRGMIKEEARDLAKAGGSIPIIGNK